MADNEVNQLHTWFLFSCNLNRQQQSKIICIVTLMLIFIFKACHQISLCWTFPWKKPKFICLIPFIKCSLLLQYFPSFLTVMEYGLNEWKQSCKRWSYGCLWKTSKIIIWFCFMLLISRISMMTIGRTGNELAIKNEWRTGDVKKEICCIWYEGTFISKIFILKIHIGIIVLLHFLT